MGGGPSGYRYKRALAALTLLACSTAATHAADAPKPSEATLFTLRLLDDKSGGTIDSATVTFYGGERQLKTTTDPGGEARYGFKPDARQAYVVANDDNIHVPMSLVWNPSTEPGADHYDLRLPLGTKIGGRVIDDNGKPIAGATVVIDVNVTRASAWPHEAPDVRYVNARTDNDGKWSYAQAPAKFDSIEIGAWHPAYLASTGNEGFFPMEKVASPDSLRDGSFTLTLHTGVPINGQVVDSKGKPVANVSIGLGGDRIASNVIPPIKSRRDGKFMILATPNMPVTLTATFKAFAPSITTFQMPATPYDLKITLQPPRTLMGRVVDKNGKPIAGAMVAFDSWHGQRTLDKQVTTDDNGIFTWNGAPADAVKADVMEQGYADQRGISMSPDKENDVTLLPPLKVMGTVIDDATGKPVPEFRMIRGIDFKEQSGITWERSNRPDRDAKGHDGTFTMEFSYPYPGNLIRIEAPGYLPCDSPSWAMTDGDQKYTFRLKHGHDVAGTVTNPDGKPAANIDMGLIVAGNPLMVMNGRIGDYMMSALRGKTDANGHFDFPPQTGEYRLIALSDQGVADLTVNDAKSDIKLTLKPWGHVNGVAMVGKTPVAGATIQGSRNSFDENSRKHPQISYQYSANANAAGKFAFDRVAPDTAFSFGRQVPEGSRMWTTTDMTKAQVGSGETQSIRIGGKGRPVVGKVILPPALANQNLESRATLVTARSWAEPKYPENFAKLSPAEKTAWLKTWRATPQGKAFEQQMVKQRDQMHFYNVPIKPDRTFRIENVEAGDYNLSIIFSKPGASQFPQIGNIVANAKTKVTVPAPPDGVYTDDATVVPDLTAAAPAMPTTNPTTTPKSF